ncbi:MAG: hypothetical protein KBT19_01630 [Lachnospiraceae bacterium]|nr:hypothetical protein [Candidatus Colinaster equi]
MNSEHKTGKFKRIVALVGVIILVLMYVLLLVFALLQVPNWRRLFIACLAMTIAIPIFIWINFFLYDALAKRKNRE